MTVEQVELKPFNNPKSLSEIYQKTGFHFAFVSKNLEICHEWAKCRDFLHDAVKTQITGSPSNIYGFTFDKAKNPEIDLKKMRMALIKEGAEGNIADKAVSALKILNHFENHANISLSKMKEVTTSGPKAKKRVFLYTGSATWLKSPFLVSMYSFLIRLGDKELSFENAKDLKDKLKGLAEQTDTNDNDKSYLRTLWPVLHKILKNRKELFKQEKGFHDVYFKQYSIEKFHNYCGILSLAKAVTPDDDLNTLIRKELVQE